MEPVTIMGYGLEHTWWDGLWSSCRWFEGGASNDWFNGRIKVSNTTPTLLYSHPFILYIANNYVAITGCAAFEQRNSWLCTVILTSIQVNLTSISCRVWSNSNCSGLSPSFLSATEGLHHHIRDTQQHCVCMYLVSLYDGLVCNGIGVDEGTCCGLVAKCFTNDATSSSELYNEHINTHNN